MLGCSPSNETDLTKGKLRVDYVTVTDPSVGSGNSKQYTGKEKTLVISSTGLTKTFWSSSKIEVFVEKSEEALTITRIEESKNGKKKTSVVLYNPNALISYSTGEYTFTDRTSGLTLP